MVRVATPEAYRLIHDGTLALSQMERNGICIDTEYLNTQLARLDRKIKRIEDRLTDSRTWRESWEPRFGKKSKLGNRKQLAAVLFDELGFDAPEMSEESHQYKTDQDVLSDIDHPFVRRFQRWNKLKTSRSKLKEIKREVNDGFINPSFGLETARSYRGSCRAPNFQNMPIRIKEFADLIRRCIISRKKGWRIFEIDFSGIEVKIAACYHKDPVMIRYIKSGYDMHREWAAKCFKLDLDQVTDDCRYCGKNQFVFPEFYGSYYVDCARALWHNIRKLNLTTVDGVGLYEHIAEQGITKMGACDRDKPARPGTFEAHVKAMEKELWDLFKVYAQWKRDWYNQYLDRGWFEMLTGFVIHGVYKRNDVINYPVQGAAFHCLLWCLIRLQRWLTKHKMKTLLIGQIHDSIVGDGPDDELEDVIAKAVEIMTVDLPKAWDWIIVPMKVEAEAAPPGCSWADKKKLKLAS